MSTSVNVTTESFEASMVNWKGIRKDNRVEKTLSQPSSLLKLVSVVGDVFQRFHPIFSDQGRQIWISKTTDELQNLASDDERVAALGGLVARAIPTATKLHEYIGLVVTDQFGENLPEKVYLIYLWIDFNFTGSCSAPSRTRNPEFAITWTEWSMIYSILGSVHRRPNFRSVSQTDSSRSRSPARVGRLLGFFTRRGEQYSAIDEILHLREAIKGFDGWPVAQSNGEGSSSSAAAAAAAEEAETDYESVTRQEGEKSDEEEQEEQVSLDPAETVDNSTVGETGGLSGNENQMFKYALLATFTAFCVTGAFRCLDRSKFPSGWPSSRE